MKKTFVTLISLIILCSVKGQIDFDYHRDYKSLLKQSQDSLSVYYYPKLLERFNRIDSTLTDLDMIALQIGFTSYPNYKPYHDLDTERDILNLIYKSNYEEAILKCNEFLITNPVNFTANMEKGFAYMKLEKDSARFYREKFMMILNSIIASGDGSLDKPFFVLSPTDGQTLITHIFGGSIGLMGSRDDPNGYFLDILEMLKEDEESVTLYFHINHAKEKMFNKEDLKKMNEIIDELE